MKKGEGVVPISNNQLVEDLLGAEGLICIEDLVHSLATCDKHVEQVLSSLWYCLQVDYRRL